MAVVNEIIDIRNLFKAEFGIDVNVELHLHSWSNTFRFAELAIKDMIGSAPNWKSGHQTMPTTVSQPKSKGLKESTLTVFRGVGIHDNEGLGIIIYKTEGQRNRLDSIPKPTKKCSTLARTVYLIRRQIRDLYGANVEITIRGNVEKSQYAFSSKNAHFLREDASEMFLSVSSGTNWSQNDSKHWYSETWGSHRFELIGSHFNMSIDFRLNASDFEQEDSASQSVYFKR